MEHKGEHNRTVPLCVCTRYLINRWQIILSVACRAVGNSIAVGIVFAVRRITETLLNGCIAKVEYKTVCVVSQVIALLNKADIL